MSSVSWPPSRKIAILDVQVGVAHATAFDAHQDFVTTWLRAFHHRLAQGRGIGDKRLAMHHGHGRITGEPSLQSHSASIAIVGSGPADITSRVQFAAGGLPACARAPRILQPGCPRPARSVRYQRQRELRACRCPSDFKLWRSIFRRWPKAAAVTCSRTTRVAGKRIAARYQLTTDEVTLGGGTKALAATSNRIRASVRQPARTESRP